jgi:hypothetical protein
MIKVLEEDPEYLMGVFQMGYHKGLWEGKE